VFVKEEEYRMQKAQGEISPLASTNAVNGKDTSTAVIHEDGTVVTRDSTASNSTTLAEASADDDASTRGVVSSESAADVSSAGSSPNVADGIAIPTIRISTESNRESDPSQTAQEAGVNGDAKQNGVKEVGNTLEKPIQAAAGEAGEGAQEPPSPNSAQEPFSFSNKRLCERWLDNLFMVLYEVRALVPYALRLGLNYVPGPARVDNIQS
jgi:Chs5-Arf1p-binding protein BUD7/BCH1